MPGSSATSTCPRTCGRFEVHCALLKKGLAAMKKTPSKRIPPIRYTVNPKDLAGHLFEVTLRVETPAPDCQLLVLPAWIPGSYMIREFARNIVQIRA